MGDISVDYQVFMTHTHSVEKSVTIGTDGVECCVGIIAIVKEGKVFCGHLSCSISGTPYNETTVKNKTKQLMLQHVGGKDKVESIFCVTNPRDPTAQWMQAAITDLYGKVDFSKGKGIYWTGTQHKVVPGMDARLVGKTKGNESQQGPFDVK